MPRAAKICSHVGPEGSCFRTQPCPEHSPKPWEGSRRVHELPPDWRKRRAAVLARDPFCTLRTHCDGDPSTEVHHIGGKHDHRIEQLAGTCSRCHASASGSQGAKARSAT